MNHDQLARTKQFEEHQSRIITSCDSHEDIIPLEDGYHYFYIKERGAASAQDLRIIANELDRRNAAWDGGFSKTIELPPVDGDRRFLTYVIE